jgi:hypothetical protein
MIDTPLRFPKPWEQRDVAGRHYLTKPEINALYFATHQMKRPRGWKGTIPVGRYWRSALVEFFNYGLDTVGGITYRHYAHRAPLAFKAIMALPQPSAVLVLIKGHDGECPCCRRRFADALP